MEGIINDELPFEVGLVIREQQTVAGGNGLQPASQRRSVDIGGDVGGVHDPAGTNRNSARLSMKRRISQGQATRSTWTWDRVTHFMETSRGRLSRASRQLSVVNRRLSVILSEVSHGLALTDD
jgi:hypothetical protein